MTHHDKRRARSLLRLMEMGNQDDAFSGEECALVLRYLAEQKTPANQARQLPEAA